MIKRLVDICRPEHRYGIKIGLYNIITNIKCLHILNGDVLYIASDPLLILLNNLTADIELQNIINSTIQNFSIFMLVRKRIDNMILLSCTNQEYVGSSQCEWSDFGVNVWLLF